FHHLGMPDALVAQEGPDVGVVFLLHVRLVVLVVGAGARLEDLHLALGEVGDDMPVEELSSVVGVDALQGEGQGGLDAAEGFADAMLPAVPGHARLGPARGDVGEGHRPSEVAFHRAAAEGDGIRLGPARFGHRPALRPDRDDGFDRGVGFQPGTIAGAAGGFVGGQEAVDLGGADGEDLLPHGGIERALASLVGGEPFAQGGLEALAAGLLASLPDGFEHLVLFGSIPGRAAPDGLSQSGTPTTPEQFDGVLPLVAGDLAELGQKLTAGLFATPPGIAFAHLFEVFVAGFSAHRGCHPPRCPIFESTGPPGPSGAGAFGVFIYESTRTIWAKPSRLDKGTGLSYPP